MISRPLNAVSKKIKIAGMISLFALCWHVQPVYAESDPLLVPAIISAKASQAMLLSVTQAGARLVAVGEHGVIVYSDNQGKSWTQAAVPVSVTLTAVFFPDPQVGWAVGHDGVVLRSQDGGKTWEKRFDGNQANVLMLAEAKEKLDTAQNAAPGSSDAANLQAAQNALSDVEAGAKFGPARPLLGLWFGSSTDGFVVGAFGQLFHTADGGTHWTSLAGRVNNPDGLHYNAITATSHGVLLISGEGGKIYRSDNNGASWLTVDTGYQGQLYGTISIRQPGNQDRLLTFGFGGHAMLADENGGWKTLTIPSRKNLIGGVQLADGSLILVAQDGTVLRSDATAHTFQVVLQDGAASIAGMTILKSDQNSIAMATSGISGVHITSIGVVNK